MCPLLGGSTVIGKMLGSVLLLLYSCCEVFHVPRKVAS